MHRTLLKLGKGINLKNLLLGSYSLLFAVLKCYLAHSCLEFLCKAGTLWSDLKINTAERDGI